MRRAALMLTLSLSACATIGDTDRSFEKNLSLQVSLGEAWRLWSTSEGAQEWLVPEANIEAEIGGPYELLWKRSDSPEKHTVRPEVIGVKPLGMLSFVADPPPGMPEVKDARTWVIVKLERADRDKLDAATTSERVDLSVRHFGFKNGPEWDRAYAYYERFWNEALARLKTRVETGKPLAWSVR